MESKIGKQNRFQKRGREKREPGKLKRKTIPKNTMITKKNCMREGKGHQKKRWGGTVRQKIDLKSHSENSRRKGRGGGRGENVFLGGSCIRKGGGKRYQLFGEKKRKTQGNWEKKT